MRTLAVVALVLLCAAVWAQDTPVGQAANVAVTEARVDQPFVIDWAKVNQLAGRIFAQTWIQNRNPVWCEGYPSPARITTTYGQPAQGDSLTPVNDASNRRSCWVFWKDDVSGVAVEKGIRGNWIVSTFVKEKTTLTLIPGPTVYVDRPVDRPVCVPQLVFIQAPAAPSRSFINPAGVSNNWTPAAQMNTGSTVVGPWRDIVTGTLAYIPSRPTCETKKPDETCRDGEPGPEVPPNNDGVNEPGNPNGQPPGGDPVQPGVGPPAQDVPDHNTHDGAGDINYSPSDPNIADLVLPGQ